MTASKAKGYRKFFRRRKRKIGTVAIPFLLTILIATAVFGSIARYYYKRLTKSEYSLETMPAATESITENDVNNLLFIFTPDDSVRKMVVMLLHFDPIRRTEHCIGIPINMLISHNDKQITVEQCAKTYDPTTLCESLSATLGQTIDRYVCMDSEGFQKIVSIFGTATVMVTISDYGLYPKDVSQNIDTEQLETLITSNKFYNESERTATIGSAISSLINHGNFERISNNLDSYFNTFLSATTTNVAASDFADHKHAISFMFQKTIIFPAKTLTLAGVENERGEFVLHEGFPAALDTAFNNRIGDPLTEEQAKLGLESDESGEGITTTAQAVVTTTTAASTTETTSTAS